MKREHVVQLFTQKREREIGRTRTVCVCVCVCVCRSAWVNFLKASWAGWSGGGTGSLSRSVGIVVLLGYTVASRYRWIYSRRSCRRPTGCHDQHVEIQSECDREAMTAREEREQRRREKIHLMNGDRSEIFCFFCKVGTEETSPGGVFVF